MDHGDRRVQRIQTDGDQPRLRRCRLVTTVPQVLGSGASPARTIRLAATVVALSVSAACGGGSGVSPFSPSQPTSITITAQSGPLLISKTITLTATANGGAVSGTWSTDAPSVATVSATGVVTGISAGEVNVFIDSQGERGTIRLRVLPEFDGDWHGEWVSLSCVGTGTFAGGCSGAGLDAGQVNPLELLFTQSDDAVSGDVAFGGFISNSGSGTISTGGELRLTFGSAPASPSGDFVLRLRPTQWVARADTAGETTGTFTIEITADGFGGMFRTDGEIRNTSRQGAGVATPISGDLLSRLTDFLRTKQP